MEQYPQLEEPIMTFLSRITRQLVHSQSIAKALRVKEISGSRYEDIVDGKYVLKEMKAYDTKFLSKAQSIRKMDLISIGKEIYEGCKQTSKDLNKDIFQELEKSATHIDMYEESFFDTFLETMREMKKKGKDPLVVSSEAFRKRVEEEAQ